MVQLTVLGLAIGLGLIAWSSVSAYDGPVQPVGEPVPMGQEGGGPEANLPFLFAVYIITWAAFFGYVFYTSRKRREMQGEIEALKRALREREQRQSEQPPETVN